MTFGAGLYLWPTVCVMTGQSDDDWSLGTWVASLEDPWVVSLAFFQGLLHRKQWNDQIVALSEATEAFSQIQQSFCLFRSSLKAGSDPGMDLSLAPEAFFAFVPNCLHFHFHDVLKTDSYHVSRLLLLAIVMCPSCADVGFPAVQADAQFAALSEVSCRPMSLHDGMMKMLRMCCLVPPACFAMRSGLGN